MKSADPLCLALPIAISRRRRAPRTARLALAALFTLVLAAGCAPGGSNRTEYPGVVATVETDPVASRGDAADDPAIWVNHVDPASSVILGTDKKRGLAVYDLAGKSLQFIERGDLNNVDLRQGITLEGRETALAAATNRTEITLDVFEISEDGRLKFVHAEPLVMEEPYGLCMMLDEYGDSFVFVNDKSGEYQHWQLSADGVLDPRLLGEFKLQSSPEGCVVDDAASVLYAGEEERGVWKMPADAARASEKTLIDRTGDGRLVADVEGMAIYHESAGVSYLVVSSQGDDSFAVYRIEENDRYLGSFRVVDDSALNIDIDGAEETDGLDVTSVPLGSGFPHGLLVVQDGYNRHPNENQNFKIVDWREVAITLPLN